MGMRCPVGAIWIVIVLVVVAGEEDGNETNGDRLWQAYTECKTELGRRVLTCDPENALQAFGGVKKLLDDTLWRMQTEVPCYCSSEDECTRYSDFPIQSGVAAALISYSGGDLPDDLEVVAQRIYDDSKLGTPSEPSDSTADSDSTPTAASDSTTGHEPSDRAEPCDNGLLLIYAVDTRSLYFYAGSSLTPAFDHLQTHKRRIEPNSLPEYLEGMLTVLRRRTPPQFADAIQHLPSTTSRKGWMGWEVIVGMIAALLIVAVTGAALLAICCSGCCRRKNGAGASYLTDEKEACKRYEKDCKDWTRRVRHLAKQRAKMAEAMRQPDWPRRVEEAKKRLSKSSSSQLALGSSNAESSDGGVQQQQQSTDETQRQSVPYYIVSEPGVAYNNHSYNNWATYDEADGGAGGGDHQNPTPLGTIRSDRHGSVLTDGTRGKGVKRETQRCDFYFQDDGAKTNG